MGIDTNRISTNNNNNKNNNKVNNNKKNKSTTTIGTLTTKKSTMSTEQQDTSSYSFDEDDELNSTSSSEDADDGGNTNNNNNNNHNSHNNHHHNRSSFIDYSTSDDRSCSTSTSDDDDDDDELHSTTTSTSGSDTAYGEDQITDKKSRDVNRLRIMVMLVLVCAAFGISIAVFLLSRKADLEAFEIQYEGNVDKIITAYDNIFTTAIGAISGGLSVASTAHRYDHNQTYNYNYDYDTSTSSNRINYFSTLSNFHGRAGNVRSLSGALSITITQFVLAKHLSQWENYVLQSENNKWIDESHAYQQRIGIDNFEDNETITLSRLEPNLKVDPIHNFDTITGLPQQITTTNNNNEDEDEESSLFYLATWQTSPVLKTGKVNENIYNYNDMDAIKCFHTGKALFSNFITAPSGPSTSFSNPKTSTSKRILEKEEENNNTTTTSSSSSFELSTTSFFATLLSMKEQMKQYYLGDPMVYLYIPIFDSFNITTRNVVSVIKSTIHFKNYFRNILPLNVNGIQIVLDSTCPKTKTNTNTNTKSSSFDNEETTTTTTSSSFTYEIQGPNVFAVGFGDLHDPNYDYMERTVSFNEQYIEDGTDVQIEWNFGSNDDDDISSSTTYTTTNNNNDNNITITNYGGGCSFSIRIYPTENYYRTFVTSAPINVTFAVGMVFFYTILLFMFYDRLVESRQRIVLAKATQSTAIVSSLFPKNVRDRLLAGPNGNNNNGNRHSTATTTSSSRNGNNNRNSTTSNVTTTSSSMFMGTNARLKNFLGGDTTTVNDSIHGCQPIADLFPHCTVFFADISGFTAWSSSREPAQVFLLLQDVYHAFDTLAKRRKVFKVETIGDCYVAVTGLPEPQPNHAIIMSRFAWECLHKIHDVTRDLEVTLGPDTAELTMRFGLHSGPVTAGVLRGDRARFQLFGDTVNTASRMESTGISNRIQISHSTADLLTKAGKKYWFKPREDSVKAKGKGVLNTYWLNLSSKATSKAVSTTSSVSSSCGHNTSITNTNNNNNTNTNNINISNDLSTTTTTTTTPLHNNNNNKINNNSNNNNSGTTNTTIDTITTTTTTNNNNNNNNNSIQLRKSKLVGGRLSDDEGEDDIKKDRLVDWMAEILLDHVKKIIAVRNVKKRRNKELSKTKSSAILSPLTNGLSSVGGISRISSSSSSSNGGIRASKSNPGLLDSLHISFEPSKERTSLDEVKEVVSMPDFDPDVAKVLSQPTDIQIPNDIIIEMKEYVAIISSSYLKNPFHSFQHACHVTMSVTKLLKRIVAPNITDEQLEYLKRKNGNNNNNNNNNTTRRSNGGFGYSNNIYNNNSNTTTTNTNSEDFFLASHVHAFSHGIVNDPMAIFAITFSALIHDVDHQGISNTQLIKEQPDMAAKYRNKSVAEQNSLDIAWDVLMMKQFEPLRRYIFETQDELMRFRQLIVNIVLATDIFDKELNDLRKQRWLNAFSPIDDQQASNTNNLRATIVIEHIIQASDVSHTMQHWHVYRKWNACLFEEMYNAYHAGRMGADPSTFWYDGELKFFDNYVIPLAKKLKDCNVFGVSSDEYLNYAVMNRAEWEERGKEIVTELIEKCSMKLGGSKHRDQ